MNGMGKDCDRTIEELLAGTPVTQLVLTQERWAPVHTRCPECDAICANALVDLALIWQEFEDIVITKVRDYVVPEEEVPAPTEDAVLAEALEAVEAVV